MEQPNIPPRISMQTIYESIFAIFNIEKGLLFTIRELLLRPGITLHNFFFTNERNKHIKPMNFLLLMVTIATFLTLKLIHHIDADAMNGNSSISLGDNVPQKLNDAIQLLEKLISQYYHIFQLIKIPFFALATYWIFRKKQYNYAEHLIINSYIVGVTTFLYIVIMPFALLHLQTFAVISLITLIYMIYAYVQVFEEKIGIGVLKSIGCYLLANVLHIFLVALVVGVIYLFI